MGDIWIEPDWWTLTDEEEEENLNTTTEEPEPDLSSCPYYQGTGTCKSGCYSEPSCITDRPRDGWPSERIDVKAG